MLCIPLRKDKYSDNVSMPLNGKFLCVVIIDSTEECFLTNGKMYACNIFFKKK